MKKMGTSYDTLTKAQQKLWKKTWTLIGRKYGDTTLISFYKRNKQEVTIFIELYNEGNYEINVNMSDLLKLKTALDNCIKQDFYSVYEQHYYY